MRRLLLAVLVAASGMLFTPTAEAADAGACAILGGSVDISPGIQMLPHTNHFEFGSGSFNCTTIGPGNGAWNVSASADSEWWETCAAARGTGRFTGGSSPSGSVTGGEFIFVRAATTVVVTGTVRTANESYPFAAVLEFVQSQGDCLNGVTKADVKGGLALGSPV